ncbi:MAG: exonuclease SbcCD subunit D, partial [Granulosicoccaceae bacterium]
RLKRMVLLALLMLVRLWRYNVYYFIPDFLGFNYSALGHLHQPQQQGAAHVRYSGSLAKYSFSEANHKKSISLIDLAADGSCRVELLPLTPKRDLRIVQGTLDQLLANAPNDNTASDYLLVRLDDEHALLDVMSRLRAVYPNVLQLERPGLLNRAVEQVEHSQNLKRDELPLFADFFEQMRGEQLSDDQRKVLTQAIEEIRKEGEQ